MFLRRYSASAALKRQVLHASFSAQSAPCCNALKQVRDRVHPGRFFSSTSGRYALQPYFLADIGEGITECQVVSWVVKEGDFVEQFSPICEVQSDKASVEITSRFEGVVKKLHYEEGDMAQVGSALLDIDVAGEEESALEQPTTTDGDARETPEETGPPLSTDPTHTTAPLTLQATDSSARTLSSGEAASARSWSSVLATPAVRRLLHENDIDITRVQGTGRDGRVLKYDVVKYIEAQSSQSAAQPPAQSQASPRVADVAPAPRAVGDQKMTLSPLQNAMFKTMTASLSIPHFLFTHSVDFTSLASIVKNYKTDEKLASRLTDKAGNPIKVTLLPFVLKALSQAACQLPVVNSSINGSGERPEVLLRGSHNFGIAVDTPNGLVVPVVRDVQNHSILSLAGEISRLATLAKAGKLTPADMADATLVVSNIGSIGGSVVGPVILSPMTAIVALGQTEAVPAFETGEDGVERIVKKEKAVLSWSADHRLLDGATIARCAQEVATWLEKPELFGLGDK